MDDNIVLGGGGCNPDSANTVHGGDFQGAGIDDVNSASDRGSGQFLNIDFDRISWYADPCVGREICAL